MFLTAAKLLEREGNLKEETSRSLGRVQELIKEQGSNAPN
jgi:hypothetical protein